jgi:hypothetical protein
MMPHDHYSRAPSFGDMVAVFRTCSPEPPRQVHYAERLEPLWPNLDER